MVVLELVAIGQAMVRAEPVVEQGLGGLGSALIAVGHPIPHLLANGRHARGGFQGQFQEGHLRGVGFLLAGHVLGLQSLAEKRAGFSE